MNLLKRLFQRPPPIRDLDALADFIDAQSAFITQKGIYEYSRARAGHYSKVLFAEEGFAWSVERARWQAFPLGLSMVGEMIEGVMADLAMRAPTARLAAIQYYHRRLPFDRIANGNHDTASQLLNIVRDAVTAAMFPGLDQPAEVA